MLILTRRVGETVMIGDDVTVTVLGVKGCQVRIGVNAPKSVPVHREEIYERIAAENASPPAGGITHDVVEVTRSGVLGGGADMSRQFVQGARVRER